MFQEIRYAVNKQFMVLTNSDLFVVGLDKNTLFNAYLDTFTDPVERQQHNCSCCKSFLRNYGNVIAIVAGKVKTVWDFELPINSEYRKVPSALRQLVLDAPILSVFATKQKKLGTEYNLALKEEKSVRFEHFYSTYPTNKVLGQSQSVAKYKGDANTNRQVIQRGLEDVKLSSVNTVLQLIDNNSLPRGLEFKNKILLFKSQLEQYLQKQTQHDKDLHCWTLWNSLAIRNTAIGVLLLDLSEDMFLEQAVNSYKQRVAAHNYRRSSADVSISAIQAAKDKLISLGLEDSLKRRHATIEDIPLNNVLYINKEQSSSDPFDALAKDVPIKIKNICSLQEIPISDFVENILSDAYELEALVSPNQSGNLMSVLAPIIEDSPSLFKWNNKLSWAYSNDVADSTKQLVKDKGGNVNGYMRFSIRWNDKGDNNVDFDAHCLEPNGNIIHYPNKQMVHTSSGMLDVDIINPANKIAVENITWSDKNKIQEGNHSFIVHNYCSQLSKSGFTAEIEVNGKTRYFSYPKCLRGKEKITVANGVFLEGELNIGTSQLEVESNPQIDLWNLKSNIFSKVSAIMLSPNSWNRDQGNKHTFFILEGLLNTEKPRGMFNEFLKPELHEHRKVFEKLGDSLRVPDSENQLSGIGFNDTETGELIVRVNRSKIIKVIFN